MSDSTSPAEASAKFWLVWSPEGEAPPKKRYSDWGGATRTARMLAAKFPDA